MTAAKYNTYGQPYFQHIAEWIVETQVKDYGIKTSPVLWCGDYYQIGWEDFNPPYSRGIYNFRV